MPDPLGSDTGREWIEVYNNSSNSIDLTKYKLFEANVNHGISHITGQTMLVPGDYAVIADNSSKFLLDYPSYSGSLFDSAFSLSNSGEYLSLKLNDQTIYEYTYTSSDEGLSTSLVFGTFNEYVNANPTPGAKNGLQVNSSSSSTTQTLASSTITKTQTEPAVPTAPSPDIIITLAKDRTVIAGAYHSYEVNISKRDGTQVTSAVVWSFGDGGSSINSTTTYRYLYPGIYNAFVTAKTGNAYGQGFMKVTVVAPELEIADFKSDKFGGYIEIKNLSNRLLDLGSLNIVTRLGTARIPENTYIDGYSSIKLSLASLYTYPLGVIEGDNISIGLFGGDTISSYVVGNKKSIDSSKQYTLDLATSSTLSALGVTSATTIKPSIKSEAKNTAKATKVTLKEINAEVKASATPKIAQSTGRVSAVNYASSTKKSGFAQFLFGLFAGR